MPEEVDDVDGFLDGIRETSDLVGGDAPQQGGVGAPEPPARPQERVKAAPNVDHQAGVILQDPATGKEAYAPQFTPSPHGDQERHRLAIRPMAEFGDDELGQIIDHPTNMGLFLGDWGDGPPAFQVTCEALNGYQIIVAQGGMAWEQDPGWSRFFKRYRGEPMFSRGGGYENSQGDMEPNNYFKDRALAALNAIQGRYK